MEKDDQETSPFRVVNFHENSSATSQTPPSYPAPIPHTVITGISTPRQVTPVSSAFAANAQVNANAGEGSSTAASTRNSEETSIANKKPSLTSHMANRRLKGYRFEDSIREFTPDKLFKNKSNKRRESYVVNGVNILNRDEIDSQAAMSRIQKRREQHNRVERKRRDLINSAIEELSEIVPNAQEEGIKYARGNVLRLTIDYIRDLQTEVQELRFENEALKRDFAVPRLDPAKKPPVIIINHEQSRNPSNNASETIHDMEMKISQDNLGFPAYNPVQPNSNPYYNGMTSPQNTPLLSSSQGSPVSSPFHSPVSPQRPSESAFLLPPAAMGNPAPNEHFRPTERRYSDGLLSPYLITTNTQSFSQLRIRNRELQHSTHGERLDTTTIPPNQGLLSSQGYSNSPPPPPSSPRSPF